MTDSAEADWADPHCVLAIMLYPHDAKMRASYRAVSAAQHAQTVEPAILERASERMRESVTRIARRAITAGDVLAVLYAMDKSPWRIEEPSIGKAVDAIMHFAKIEQYADAEALPAGKTEIHARIVEFRSVWHLWGTWRLLREYPIRLHHELFTTDAGLLDFIRGAASVQEWAKQWQPRRGERRPLLSDDAYLIPSSALPRLPNGDLDVRKPCWTHEPDWLMRVISQYKARIRS